MPQERAERRLTAIFAADVAGYSRLMGMDEEGTLARLNAHRREFLEPTVSEHRGRIVKRTGDGILIEFASAVDAVRCAVETQRGMGERNANVPPDRRIELRIGVHVGDIIIEEGDIFGDGVNVAARLEGIAEPGGVCISDDTYRQVRGKLDATFDDGGEQLLKNIDHPVRIYRMRPGGATAAPPPRLALPEKPSIAVLPFQNLSGDPEQDYFAEGMVEDIITGLSRIKWLFVIARNSSFAYTGKSPDIRQIGRDLGVRYVLEGSVRKLGNRIRITAQLLEAETGVHIWVERYDRTLDDIFVLQDEITNSVVGCLEPELYAAEHTRLQRKPPQSLDAWECFIRAIFLFSRHSDEDSSAGLSLLDRAINLDHEYGQAYGLKGFILIWRAFQGWEEMGSAIERAMTAVTRAIACHSQEPWAYMARGFVAIATRDNPQALDAFRHAIELSPNCAYAHAGLGSVFAVGGRPQECIESTNQAVRLSPRDTFSDDFQLFYAFAHFQAGRYAEAAAFAEKAIELRPAHPMLHLMAAASFGLAGDEKKASDALAKLRALRSDVTPSYVEKTSPYVLAEDRARILQGLHIAGLR